ncbi:MAG: YdcF family protein [Bacilli bacterium]|nr:YdcF family protein [Bacilli bacterium]
MKKIIIIFFVLLLLLFIVLIFGINFYVKASTKKRIINDINNIPNVDCILVLGAGIDGNKPSLMLKDRLNSGIELYDNNISNRIIMSGDHGRIEHDEVNIMKNYAMEYDIPSNDIFMDHAGFSTYDSIYRLKHIFNVKSVVVVTQKYHLYRSIYIASSLGIDAYGYPCEDIKYSGETYRNLREVLARDKDFLKTLYKPKSTYLGDKIDINGSGDITND